MTKILRPYLKTVCALVISAFSSFAQTPSLVKDGQGSWFIGGFNGWFTSVNGTLFLDASDGTTGEALWKSDGTDAGTMLVKDIYPGGASGLKEFVNVNGTLFFQANDGTHGYELWKSDGTPTGTAMVKDIWPGSTSSIIKVGTSYNGNIYFCAGDGTTNGFELWKSDGTDAGTVMVKDINPGAAHGGPSNLVVSNGILFFSATTAATGNELWKSDGTTNGTVLVKDINTGTGNSGNSGTGNLIDVNGTLFFSLTNSVVGGTTYVGYQLWKSDGTASGTVMVKGNIYSSPPAPSSFTNVNGILFYTALTGPNGIELWKSDGTTAGTVIVGDNLVASSNPSYLTNVNGTLFCSRYVDATIGTELFKSDGTDAGTVMVKDIYPGAGSSGPTYLTNVNGTAFFWANDGTHGVSLWKSNGTSAGTLLVQSFISPAPFPLTNVSGTWFFAAYPGLWKLVAGPNSVGNDHGQVPNSFELEQNYPNPFNPSTLLNYSLPFRANVSLVVYDILGRNVADLANGYHEAGYHSATWNANNQASGVYFVRFEVSNLEGKSVYTKINKLVLMK